VYISHTVSEINDDFITKSEIFLTPGILCKGRMQKKKIWDGVLGKRRRRRLGGVSAGDEIETPKASRVVGDGEGVSPSSAD